MIVVEVPFSTTFFAFSSRRFSSRLKVSPMTPIVFSYRYSLGLPSLVLAMISLTGALETSAAASNTFSAVNAAAVSSGFDTAGITLVPVVLTGGHDTDPQDHGRPIDLVAGALGVTSEVFREAFSKVRPVAPGEKPDEARARQNKAVLLSALGKYGVTSELLDAVSDRYRYEPRDGLIWPNKPAEILAVVKKGEILAFKVTDGGYGYSSAPIISVPDAGCGPVSIRLSFGKDFQSNGSISSVDFQQ